MKVGKYSCDGGCLMIGNASFRFSIPNRYGDGEHRVYVTDLRYDIPNEAKFVGSVEGDAINVYNYDCYSRLEDLYENILFTLRGRYTVFVDSDPICCIGDVYFLRG